ncbi:HEAT repeat domain-containing protein [Mycobacterium sp. SMC-17]|uniref:HEAT repeat domain-containing protein n=1 Tax=Mycobacterium sp. SMC-17 TaxID=3381628 RepID=UPI0038772FF5
MTEPTSTNTTSSGIGGLSGRDQDDPQRLDAVTDLRRAIAAIEATTADLPRDRVKQARVVRRQPRRRPPPVKQNADGSWPPIVYDGMPEGEGWMDHLPARYHHGQRGFDRRIMEELAAVGAPCYTLNQLSDRVRYVPQGIPIFIDWLTHLEERIPGPETDHRQAVRIGLIRGLDDTAIRGNRQAFDALVAELRRGATLPGPSADYAHFALARIATVKDFPTIAALLEQLPPEAPRGALIEYMGRVKTLEAQQVVLKWLDTEWTWFAIRALIAMKASGVRDRIAPYVDDANSNVRKYAKRALERLPD